MERKTLLLKIALIVTTFGFAQMKNSDTTAKFINENTQKINEINSEIINNLNEIATIDSLVNMSIVYNNQKYCERTIELVLKAEKHARTLKDTKQLGRCYIFLVETYDKMGIIDKSLQWFELHKSFHDMKHIVEMRRIEYQYTMSIITSISFMKIIKKPLLNETNYLPHIFTNLHYET